MLTKEELIAIGVNPDNLTYPNGEMNVIVQCFSPEDIKDVQLYPEIFMPRKYRVYGEHISLEIPEDKADWVKHLRDSAERLKIVSYYLTCQANEIEEFGYPKTDCYYPE